MKFNFLKHTNLYFISFFICFGFCFHFKSFAQQTPLQITQKKDSVIKNAFPTKNKKEIKFNGVDGPYIINDTLLYRVTEKNKLVVTPFFKRDSVVVNTDNKNTSEFYLALEDNYKIPETTYSLPEKIVVISDIEGNFNAFTSLLQASKIIDINYNWIYGNGHLVLGGDFVDRGKNVTQVLWLIYKLELQAKKQNGVVHFILGNHEVLNFYGDYRYNHGKYIKAAQAISQLKDKKDAVKYLYSKNSELGKWLATKNVIEKIGDYIFVHAGLSPEILDYKLSLNDINNFTRIGFDGIKNTDDKTMSFLYGSKSPFWYRGLVMKRYKYSKITNYELDAILNYYDAKKIVIGHTVVKTISTDFNGKVIRTDVHHGTTKFSGDTKGLLIENGQEFVIDDTSGKFVLQN